MATHGGRGGGGVGLGGRAHRYQLQNLPDQNLLLLASSSTKPSFQARVGVRRMLYSDTKETFHGTISVTITLHYV
jgi:hypothetical protein